MKIDRIIVTSDDNPEYQSYWPYFAMVCKHVGLFPTLVWVTSSTGEFPYPSEYGSIVRVKKVTIFSSAHQALILRFLALAGLPGVNTLGDIDVFVSSKRYEEILSENYREEGLLAYAGEDPNTFLRENKIWENWVPQIRTQGITAKNTVIQKVLSSNNIHVSDNNFWSEQIAQEILKMPRDYISYPAAFDPNNNNDQFWMSQLLHHHMMLTPDFRIQYLKPPRENTRDYPFGESSFWWPKWAEMPKLQKDLEKEGVSFDSNIVQEYIAIHWYRDKTKISTKKVVDCILSR